MKTRRDSGEPELATADTAALSSSRRAEMLSLFAAAYRQDLTDYLRAVGPGTHVLGRVGGRLVTHAMWVTRWLQPGERPPLRTAYIELVATHPEHQRRGYASRALGELVALLPPEIEIAALSPATEGIYARLGWCAWRGPLAIRRADGTLVQTPAERVLIQTLPASPELDRDEPLTAEWREGELW